jgi:[ribosomal protein S5]-alanine N-acetyltransferase
MVTIAQTDRLLIRSWKLETDVESAFEIYRNPEVTHFLKTKVDSLTTQRQVLQRWINRSTEPNNGTGVWAMVHQKTGEIVGTILLIPLPSSDGKLTQEIEINWHLKRSSWGQGYATEAAKAMLEYGFNTLNLPVVYAVVNPQNTASIRVTQRSGMKPLGRVDRYYSMQLELFQLTAADWKNTQTVSRNHSKIRIL